MNKNQIRIISQIGEYYGREHQEIQAIQELAELISELARRPDQRTDKKLYMDNLIGEMADSLVVIEQVRQLHGIEQKDIEQRITAKLNRQLQRMSKEVDRHE